MAVRCSRPWAPTSPCCRKVFGARPIVQPMAPSSSVLRERAPPTSTARCSNGGRTTCSWCRHGSAISTPRRNNRCCFPSLTGRCRKRWEFGATINEGRALAERDPYTIDQKRGLSLDRLQHKRLQLGVAHHAVV